MDGSSLQGLTGDEAADLRHWMANAEAGERFSYYTGFLAPSINADGEHLSETERKKSQMVARVARAAAERGLIHLLQRRLGENRFEYFAVARPHRAESSPCPSTCWRVVR